MIMIIVSNNPIVLRIVILRQHKLNVRYDVSLQKQFMFYSMNKMVFFSGKKFIYIYNHEYSLIPNENTTG